MAHIPPILGTQISKVHWVDRIGTGKKIHRKITATEFGPLGGRALMSASWRVAASPVAVSSEIEEVAFRTGGTFPG
jgi:hypothetical protein